MLNNITSRIARTLDIRSAEEAAWYCMAAFGVVTCGVVCYTIGLMLGA